MQQPTLMHMAYVKLLEESFVHHNKTPIKPSPTPIPDPAPSVLRVRFALNHPDFPDWNYDNWASSAVVGHKFDYFSKTTGKFLFDYALPIETSIVEKTNDHIICDITANGNGWCAGAYSNTQQTFNSFLQNTPITDVLQWGTLFESVEVLTMLFYNDSALVNIPNIPESMPNISSAMAAFSKCTSLTGYGMPLLNALEKQQHTQDMHINSMYANCTKLLDYDEIATKYPRAI